MIKEVKSYSLICNNCGETYRHKWTNYALWFDESAPLEYASEEGWIEHENKHYCPNCYEIDNDDNVIIKERDVRND